MRRMRNCAESEHTGTSCSAYCERPAGAMQGPAVLPRSQTDAYTLTGWACAIIASIAIIDCMASITVRNLEEKLKHRLKVRAAQNGRSMEQEAREILKSALDKPNKPKSGADLVKRIRSIWEPLGGIELELPPRQPMRDPDWIKDWK